MKILVLAKGYPPLLGGVENYSRYIAEGLGEKHNVRVLTFKYSGEGQKFQADAHAVVQRMSHSNSDTANFFPVVISLLKEIVLFRPEVIIATTWKMGLPYVVLQKITGAKFVLITHGAEITRHKKHKFMMGLMSRVVGSADLVCAVSHYTKSIVEKYTGRRRSEISVIWNGIDESKIKPMKEQEAKKQIGLTGRLVLLTVARIEKRKGHLDVIRTLPELVDRHPNIIYVIAGTGNEKEKLKEECRRLGVSEFVRFEGYVEEKNLPYYYSACDIFVMPNKASKDDTDFEGFGLVFAEAGAYGKPCIAGSIGGSGEVVIDGQTGFTVKSAEELSEALKKLCSEEQLRNKLGSEGRARVNENFLLGHMVSRLEENVKQI